METSRREEYMRRALRLAEEAAAAGEIPVGCVVTDAEGAVLAEGRNRRKERGDAIDRLVEAARVQALNDEDRDLYIRNMESAFDIQSEIWYARQEGEARGEAKGRAEGASARTDEIARNLKADGVSPELVSRYTGLTPEQVQAL